MWYNESGDNTDIVLASKVTIIRNVRGYQFPGKMNEDEQIALLGAAEAFAPSVNMSFVSTKDMTNDQRLEFLNNKMINLEFAQNSSGKGLLYNEDKSISVLVNNNNHFTVQGICNGSKVDSLFGKVEKVATEIEKKFDVAFSETLGFLTAKPIETGTGLRVSFLVSIPGIEKGGLAQKINNRLSSLDWKMVPYVGDSNKKTGNIYTIFNLSTLGVTESKIYERALTVLNDVLKVERMCREALYNKNKLAIEDYFYRAYGVLKYCRKIELDEALEAVGWLRFGFDQISEKDLDIDLLKINKITDRICTELRNTNFSNSFKFSEARAKQIRAILEGEDN